MKLEQCLQGHPRVVKALSALSPEPQNRITYQPGNHDMEFVFPGSARCSAAPSPGEDTHPRIRFITDSPTSSSRTASSSTTATSSR